MTLEPRARTKLSSALLLLLVLGAGVVLGVALDRQLEARNLEGGEVYGPEGRSGGDRGRSGFDPREGSPSGDRDTSRRRRPLIVDQVGLTEVQKQQVDSIVGFYRAELRRLHEEFDEAYSTRYREIMTASREGVRGVLTAEQLVAYDSLLAEMRRRREEERGDSTSRPGGREGQTGRGRPSGPDH